MTREQELEQRYQDFQEWLNQCPLVVTDYQDFTDLFQITFSLNEKLLTVRPDNFYSADRYTLTYEEVSI